MADLVVFGEDWGGLPSSTQHLIKHLLKKHRVIWVNSIGMRSPQLNRQDLFRLFHKAVNMLKPVQKKPWTVFNNSPLIINPKVIPFHGIKPIRCLNTYLLRRAILKVMGKEDFSDILLWISLPTAVDLVGRLGEKASLYYCGDDFEALDGVDHKIVAPLERKLVSCVDVVLVASEKLADKYPEKTPVILPHGVDFELFSKPMPRPFDLPAQGQIAGFYGSLSNWLDIEMLAQSATALSNWHFVFIGPVKTDISTLENLPNTHFLGPRPHSQLPSYVQHWDVALLPFRKTPQIRACNPLKLREYMASGTPIASTAFPAVEAYCELIAIQNTKEPFSQVILKALRQKEKASLRQNHVSLASWSHQSTQLDQLIGHLLSQ